MVINIQNIQKLSKSFNNQNTVKYPNIKKTRQRFDISLSNGSFKLNLKFKFKFQIIFLLSVFIL